MYMSEENFQYLENLTRRYAEEQRKQYKEIMFRLLEEQGCSDLSILMVMCREAVMHMPFPDVITKRMIKRVHRAVTRDRVAA